MDLFSMIKGHRVVDSSYYESQLVPRRVISIGIQIEVKAKKIGRQNVMAMSFNETKQYSFYISFLWRTHTNRKAWSSSLTSTSNCRAPCIDITSNPDNRASKSIS